MEDKQKWTTEDWAKYNEGIAAEAEHRKAFLKCLELYNERRAAYGEAWRNYGAVSNLLSAARKVDRLMETWYHDAVQGVEPSIHKEALDDAYDAINYLNFFIRNAKVLNFTGEAPERPEEVTAVMGWLDRRVDEL